MKNHRTGNEQQWWQVQKLDPLVVEAEKLWRQSKGEQPTIKTERIDH